MTPSDNPFEKTRKASMASMRAAMAKLSSGEACGSIILLFNEDGCTYRFIAIPRKTVVHAEGVMALTEVMDMMHDTWRNAAVEPISHVHALSPVPEQKEDD